MRAPVTDLKLQYDGHRVMGRGVCPPPFSKECLGIKMQKPITSRIRLEEKDANWRASEI